MRAGPSTFSMTLEDAPGGTPQTLVVLNQVALKKISQMMEITPLGVGWTQHKPIGVRQIEPIAVEGLWRTGVNESHDVLDIQDADVDPNSVGRELVATPDAGDNVFTVTIHISEYEVRCQVGEFTRFSAVFTPDGEGGWTAAT